MPQEGSPTASTAEAVELVFPHSGERFVFRSPPSRTDRFEFDFFVAPGGGVDREHRHLHQTETFHCRAGELTVSLDGERVVIGPGESVTIRPGVAHTLLNGGDVEVRCDVAYAPAGRNREWFQLIGARSARTGKEPGLLDLGPFIGDVGIYVTGPPISLQKVLFRWILRPLGILLGRRRRMLETARQAYGQDFAW